jgi:hypothetical protein|eukprot:COSAG06_NODE_1176_length_10405_cov_6045.623751_3_plen_68_part_00
MAAAVRLPSPSPSPSPRSLPVVLLRAPTWRLPNDPQPHSYLVQHSFHVATHTRLVSHEYVCAQTAAR